MTLEVALDILTARNRHTVPEQFLERQLLKQVMNFAIMSRYPVMLAQCKWFLQTTASWVGTNHSSATSSIVAKPADCWVLLGVRVDQAKAKCATKMDVRQYAGIQANSIQSATLDYPKYREDKDAIEIFGANTYTGTYDYLRSPSYLDDETFELTDANANALPVFHWFLEEEILNEADYQLRERSRGAADAPSAIAQMAQKITSAMEEIRQASDPMAIYGLTIPGGVS